VQRSTIASEAQQNPSCSKRHDTVSQLTLLRNLQACEACESERCTLAATRESQESLRSRFVSMVALLPSCSSPVCSVTDLLVSW
jgi:hypothetical protein